MAKRRLKTGSAAVAPVFCRYSAAVMPPSRVSGRTMAQVWDKHGWMAGLHIERQSAGKYYRRSVLLRNKRGKY